MPWYSYIAIYFILWWLVLFAVLPFGVRSQHEADEITPGTEHGAPTYFSFWRKILLTTVVSLAVFGAYFLVTVVLGYTFDDIPNIVPTFD